MGLPFSISVYNLLLTAEQWFDYDQTHCELLIWTLIPVFQDVSEAMLDASMLWAVQAHLASAHAARLSFITFGLQRTPPLQGRRVPQPVRYAAPSLAR